VTYQGQVSADFTVPVAATAPNIFTINQASVVVNSPVAVTVNGKPAEFLAAVGFPGAVDGYQVNFRMPRISPKGWPPFR